ncbi:THUMP domain-containing class I SAM-dependent RNA methyltransferase [Pelagibacterium lentulum]|uniref:RNA methyltransferase n=1 Tax=Pelagibacterium lentulum TaxID=2029865 RepID=A0A916RNJ8_9HYPH|nr:class I SAM-dependent RNA methyltransferase [Pelagibacterium lentulum]GGA63063.1 RNA methyltransferase [Pelagibacterium lentulum]
MEKTNTFEIFLVCAPGLEAALCDEAREKGFAAPKAEIGGVTIAGRWPDVWRANLELRGAARVLARFATFRAMHLAQLDKRARKIDWGSVLRADVPVKVEASCKRSRIYHAGAASQRIGTAINEELGAPVSERAELIVKARIENDLVTLSVDTSGEGLHKRGYKEAVNKAPMRETLAALFLRQCGYDGSEPVVDPMCGSGTFVIEAAEIAAGLMPGRGRSFAFEQLSTFNETQWQKLRAGHKPVAPEIAFYGSDRDPGAVRMSDENAERAGVAGFTRFAQLKINDLRAPEGPKGLVIVNPPYGTRLGNKKQLFPVYAALGAVLKEGFSGWRVGLITSDPQLAKATGLPFGAPLPSVDNSGLRITLYRTDALP